MKISVFGATGNLGKRFVSTALEKGHQIVAYVRSPEKMSFQNENLTVIKGDVFDKDKIAKSIQGTDAVFISWRMRSQKIPLFSEGTQNVVECMKKNDIQRIIVMSEYAYGDHFRNFGFVMKGLTKLYGKMAKFQQNERRLQDTAIYESGLDWTINRIRSLADKPTKDFKMTLEPKSKVGSVSFESAASKIVSQFENPKEFIQKDIYF
ncbi:NAD(P)-dependent oxidoreductase [Candidatus Lokiarchaeum ossiferum]|uniref:NAD(P)-dependent oxidoreductase n=1 Tax=Candidatus Lokiarchaeum ossiferum TaxID=2951803 RepID=UPI00352C2C72